MSGTCRKMRPPYISAIKRGTGIRKWHRHLVPQQDHIVNLEKRWSLPRWLSSCASCREQGSIMFVGTKRQGPQSFAERSCVALTIAIPLARRNADQLQTSKGSIRD